MGFLINAKTQSLYPVAQCAIDLILLFINIIENIRNYRKIAVKLRGNNYKITYITAANRVEILKCFTLALIFRKV